MFARRTALDLRPNPLAAALARRQRPFTDLTVSNPTAVGLEYPEKEILAAWALPAALRYGPDPRGLLAAREAIAAYYAARGAPIPADFAAERLILAASTSEAYTHLFRMLCDAGDRVHVPRPSYPLLDHLATLTDVELERYPLWYEQGWHLDLAQLERDISHRSRAIVVVNPNNPTGSYSPPAEWSEVTKIAARYRLALIVDEVFFDYCWPQAAPPAQHYFASEAPLVFVLNGLSKICGLPQAKLAWIAVAGTNEVMRRAALEKLEWIADTFLSAGGGVQHGAAALLATRAITQPRIARRVAENLAALDRALAGQCLVTRLAGEGGWSAVLRWPKVRSDEAWAELLLERADVLVHPGHFYDFATDAMLVVGLLAPPQPFASALARALPLANAE